MRIIETLVLTMVLLALVGAIVAQKYVYDDCRTNTDLSKYSCFNIGG